jgi:hypothetical protein
VASLAAVTVVIAIGASRSIKYIHSARRWARLMGSWKGELLPFSKQMALSCGSGVPEYCVATSHTILGRLILVPVASVVSTHRLTLCSATKLTKGQALRRD